MYKTKVSLHLYFKLDNKIIYELNDNINEKDIIKCAKYVENLLIKNKVNPSKIKNVFELMIETMQNMLHYAYKNIELNNQKTDCIFKLSHNLVKDSYVIQSCNLIEEYQKEIIEENFKEVAGLDHKALRKLTMKKMRTKVNKHKKGAGLGFVIMAKKSIEPMEIKFLPYKNNILQYDLKLMV